MPTTKTIPRTLNEELSKGDTGEQVLFLQAVLNKLGYLQTKPEEESIGLTAPEAHFDEDTQVALRKYQNFHGLSETGKLDQNTLNQMSLPRCGLPDVNLTSSDFKAQGNRWGKTGLNFKIENITSDLPENDVRNAIISALSFWSKVTPLVFTETNDNNVDIRIKFSTFEHGDGSPFDGQGGILAHGFSPPPNGGDIAGDVHFDDSEVWSVNTPASGIDLLTVAIHEFGHSLGLNHSNVKASVSHRYLHEDDIEGIQSIYGKALQSCGNSVILQSKFGNKGNFELITPLTTGGLAHYWRNNDDPNLPWSSPTVFATGLGRIEALTFIQSNFGIPGNFEVFVRVGERLATMWCDSQTHKWSEPTFLFEGVTGNPTVIQSRFGNKGNFELITPLTTGGLAHYWRNNDDPNLPWSSPTVFATGLGRIEALTFIQSNFGIPGNFEVFVRVGERLATMWCDSQTHKWSEPTFLFEGVTGNPTVIQSRFGNKGNFELITPLTTGGLAHYWRNNDDPNLPWSSPTVFATGLGRIEALTFIQSNFGVPGNFEVFVRVGERLATMWCDSQTHKWSDISYILGS